RFRFRFRRGVDRGRLPGRGVRFPGGCRIVRGRRGFHHRDGFGFGRRCGRWLRPGFRLGRRRRVGRGRGGRRGGARGGAGPGGDAPPRFDQGGGGERAAQAAIGLGAGGGGRPDDLFAGGVQARPAQGAVHAVHVDDDVFGRTVGHQGEAVLELFV